MAPGGSHRGESGRPGSHRAHSVVSANGSGKAASKAAFKIPSQFAAGHEVQKRILEKIEEAGFNERSFFAIKLALEEALVNAIKHGNQLDPEKTVTITVRISRSRVEICIEDEGAGFNRARVPDPTCDENLEKCSGRGILLIESYMSSVRWDRGGRRLRMVKENAAH